MVWQILEVRIQVATFESCPPYSRVVSSLKSLVQSTSNVSPKNSRRALEAEFAELSVGGSMPSNFSKLDIYSDRE